MKYTLAITAMTLSLFTALHAESDAGKASEKPSVYASLDQNKDGKITYEEYYGHKVAPQKEDLKKRKEKLEFEEQNLATKEAAMMKKFKRMDLDGDGVLQERELKAFLPKR